MELIIAVAIGVFTSAGVWLILRPRTFQVLIGLSLIGLAVNLFIFSSGGLLVNKAPIVDKVLPPLSQVADPVPQALVLTAIVIGFAATALFLVLLMVLRGVSGSDHVDGFEKNKSSLNVQRDFH